MSVLSLRDHFAPHLSRRFDGYYTRTQTEDGATIAVIFCWVKGAKRRGNLVLVLYQPGAGAGLSIPAFKHQFFPDHFDVSVGEATRGDSPQGFVITAPGIGSMKVSSNTIEYDIAVPEKDLRLNLVLTDHTPWSRTDPLDGPMGPILHLSRLLPLNWHVRSTQSVASYTLAHGPAGAGESPSLSGTGQAHAEKNWGASFPQGWIWAQAFSADGRHTLCVAGGAALPWVPLQAYLVGYRSPACGAWDFRPPFALAVGPLAPFIHVRHDSRRGVVEMDVTTWTRRLRVKIEAPLESFVGITAPLKDGHALDFAHESFEARVSVEVFSRRWPWSKWELVEEAVLGQTGGGVNCGVLEFGGSFSHFRK
ncbi:hypothetical protein C8Q79DRAFT_926201 [Trametes meyenii]|nr:hypothetical protein C8Q79DRAFT_926201 [Trametes meyenii]